MKLMALCKRKQSFMSGGEEPFVLIREISEELQNTEPRKSTGN